MASSVSLSCSLRLAQPLQPARACKRVPARARVHPVFGRRNSPVRVLKASLVPITEAESIANEKRRRESGSSNDSSEKWQWTLNWNQVAENLIVGSCPRKPDDLEVIRQQSGADAIVCLQCDGCLEALKIDLPKIRQRAAELGMTHVQVSIRDFDRPDQARMLPEAVLHIALLVQEGKKVYVHCTAGINRAPLAAIGFLSFVKGVPMHQAVELVKDRRPAANPYVECLKDARHNLLAPEERTLESLSQSRYNRRKECNEPGDGFSDWVAAEQEILSMLFQRKMAAATSMQHSVKAARMLQTAASNATIRDLQAQLERLELRLQQVQQALEQRTRPSSKGDGDGVAC